MTLFIGEAKKKRNGTKLTEKKEENGSVTFWGAV